MGIRTVSPIDGSVYVERPFATRRDIEMATNAARAAQRDWRNTPLETRAELIQNGIGRLVAQQEKLSIELAWQMGRPVAQCPGEISGMKSRSDYMLGIAAEALGQVTTHDSGDARYEIRREALGVVVAITPWNYPYLTATNTIVPALAAGNCVILKPSPQAPLVGEQFAAAFVAAGVPDGVFQCLHADPQDIAYLIGKGGVDHVAFTGSIANGIQVERAVVGQFTSVGLELGGKDAAYVRRDADIDRAVSNLVDGAFYNSGQSCCAVERIYVHQECYADFLDAYARTTSRYVLGSPLSTETNLGPVVSSAAAGRIRQDIAHAIDAGARKIVNEDLFAAASPGTPYLAPQILVDVNHTMAIMQNETFGPVVGIMPVADDAEAIYLINDNCFGLTASLWTQDEDVAERLSQDIDTGTVFLNRCDSLEPSLPWTGVKQSGRGSTLSVLGFDALTRPKSLNFSRLA